MTIIIATPALMAADRQENFVTTVHSTPKKIFEVRGRLFGGAGCSALLARWKWAVERRRDGVEAWPDEAAEDDFEGLELGPDGIFVWGRWFQRYPVGGDFVAVGSGRDLAIGAHEAGATLEEALEIVFRRDSGCSGPPVIVTLEEAQRSHRGRRGAPMRLVQ